MLGVCPLIAGHGEALARPQCLRIALKLKSSKSSITSRKLSTPSSYSNIVDEKGGPPPVGARPVPSHVSELVDHSKKLSQRQADLLKLSMTDVCEFLTALILIFVYQLN